MLGAIIGDIVGSVFEFSNIHKKDFYLFSEKSEFTDDTVLTIAVLDWVLHAKNKNDNEEAKDYLLKWSKRYPNTSYGNMYLNWMNSCNHKPYNSCGNGSAMRISPVGFLIDNEKEMIKAVHTITSPTHNHPEGIKGAEVVAELIYKAKHGASKDELEEYAIRKYPKIRELNYYDFIRNGNDVPITCQETVPQAIYCFLISTSFEDCLRTTISIGGDSDTLAAISCSIAEAYYKEIPPRYIKEAYKYLPQDMRDLLNEVYKDKH